MGALLGKLSRFGVWPNPVSSWFSIIKDSGNQWTRCEIGINSRSCGAAKLHRVKCGDGIQCRATVSEDQLRSVIMKCRHCKVEVQQTFVDLGASPPSNAYLTVEGLSSPEIYFPLRVLVCTSCWLVQTEDFTRAEELFREDYAYFSSVSLSWLAHASAYVKMIIPRLGLNQESFVIEIAANDGYLLRNFVAAEIPCLGIEPTESTAIAAEKLGIRMLREFFGARLGNRLANQGERADLIIGNNVYAHVPEINDFSAGL